jgi:hypothetical protein
LLARLLELGKQAWMVFTLALGISHSPDAENVVLPFACAENLCGCPQNASKIAPVTTTRAAAQRPSAATAVALAGNCG